MTRGLPPIPSDGRLNLLVRRAAEHARNATLIARLAPDVEQKFERPKRYVDPADSRTLRGIPCASRGVPGVITGTQPESAACR
jgi:hypothetical protein